LQRGRCFIPVIVRFRSLTRKPGPAAVSVPSEPVLVIWDAPANKAMNDESHARQATKFSLLVALPAASALARLHLRDTPDDIDEFRTNEGTSSVERSAYVVVG